MSFSGKHNPPQQGTISNQPFWPDLDLTEFSVNYRIPNDLEVNPVREQLIQAITDINARLYDWQQVKKGEGFKQLSDIPSETVADESILIVLYKRAVFSRAKASISRDYPTIDRRTEAENQAKSSDDIERIYLRNAFEAVRQMMNMNDITVELI